MIDPTNTEPIPVHTPHLRRTLATAAVILLGVALFFVGSSFWISSQTEVLPPITQLAGTVRGISGNSITLDVILPGDISADQRLHQRTLMVSEGTPIMRTTLYSSEEMEQRWKEFRQAMDMYKEKVVAVSPTSTEPFTETPPPYPLSFKRDDVGLSGLSVGDEISILTTEDVRMLEEIVPESINILLEETKAELP